MTKWDYRSLRRTASESALALGARRIFHELLDRIRPHGDFHNITRSPSIGMVITEDNPNTIYGDYFTAKGLGREMEKLGYEVIYIPERPVYLWHRIPKDLTVLIVLRHTFDPRPAKRSTQALTVAWIRGYVSQWCKKPWFDSYDIILATSDMALEYASQFAHPDKCSGVLRLAADPEIFKPGAVIEDYACDLCFVGNVFDVERDLVKNLTLPPGLTFRFYGRLDNSRSWLAQYHQGPIHHGDIPKLYNSSKIVLEDCTPMCRPWGCINSRTFEALSSGACLISNDVPGLQEVFGDLVITYTKPKQLQLKIMELLKDDEQRKLIGQRGRKKVLEAHTFHHRAIQLNRILKSKL